MKQRGILAVLAILSVVALIAGDVTMRSAMESRRTQNPVETQAADPMIDALTELTQIRAAPAHDLISANLLNHDFRDCELLVRQDVSVPYFAQDIWVPALANGTSFPHEFWDVHVGCILRSIATSYKLHSSQDVIETLSLHAAYDIVRVGALGIENIRLHLHSPIRASADGQIAYFALNVDIGINNVTILFVSQAVLGSDYIVTFRVSVDRYNLMGQRVNTEETAAFAEEISRHIGIDLAAYIPWI